jgi:hypothetical protein
MTSTQVTPAADSSLAPAEGFVRMHFMVVADQDRSREFYRASFGAHIPSEPDPVILKVANSWLILNAGGGPTEDKPTISYELDKTRAADLRHQAQRDARARAARRARRVRARLNVDDAQCRRCSPQPAAVGCAGRRRCSRGGQGHHAAVRYRWLQRPDGAGARRKSGGSRRADALGPVATQLSLRRHLAAWPEAVRGSGGPS